MNRFENVPEVDGANCILKEEALGLMSPDNSTEHSTIDEVIGGKLDLLEGKNVDQKEISEEIVLLQSPVKRLSEIEADLYSSGETACGVGCLKGSFLQKFANKKVYVILYGVIGCVMGASRSYLTGTITTLEKRFKIPSTNTGVIMTGCDISQLGLGLLLNYYGDRGHRPRWIAWGLSTGVVYAAMTALPHFLYGPGEDALGLTVEYGGHHDNDTTAFLIDTQNRKVLCQKQEIGCEDDSGSFAPQMILFAAQLVSGIGGSIFFSLGLSYMDDNIKKTKTPAILSVTMFLSMLGPAAGFALASACLELYIAPQLTPTVGVNDPRYLGAWWIGWLVIGSLMVVSALVMSLLPRSLPRAAARRVLAEERRLAGLLVEEENTKKEPLPTSLRGMNTTLIRLMKNKTLMCINISAAFQLMASMPFWIFMPKYIETMYKKSVSVSNFITGSVGLVCSAIGILVSGMFISKTKPRARFLAAWNIFVGIYSALGVLSYTFLGCTVNDHQGIMRDSGQMDMNTPCNADCHCNYVKYTPVCSPDGRTFISPCHAGCTDYEILLSGKKVYKECACVTWPENSVNLSLASLEESSVVSEGPCEVECTTSFYIFLFIFCTLNLTGSTGMTTNFLVSIRCVEEKEKAISMSLSHTFMSIFALIPSPILFGHIIDKTCLLWGKTCTGTGNCWLYDGEKLRYNLNFTSAGFMAVSVLFSIGIWYNVKDLKIFDERMEQLQISPEVQTNKIKDPQ